MGATMSEDKQEFFAMVRGPECEALKSLKPSAAKLWIAIRCGRKEGEPFGAGSRDFKDWGMGRDAVASALKELVKAGLLEMVSIGGFKRGSRSKFRIVHTRSFQKNTAGKPANPKSVTAGKPGNIGRKTRQLAQVTAGKSDPPKDTSSTSSRKSEEEEVSIDSERSDEAQRDAEIRTFKRQKTRIGVAADAVVMSMQTFEEKAGGFDAAVFLALSYERGKLSKQQLRARLMSIEAGLTREDEPVARPHANTARGACG
jgi:hypothetical protein